jgi:hypothetical protein
MANEPVRDVRDVEITMFRREHARGVGTARPASIASVIQARPELDLVVIWPPDDFAQVWALAAAGRLTHGHISFTKPYRNRGSWWTRCSRMK